MTVPEKRQARFECVLTREANVIWSKGPDIIKASDKFDIIADGKKHILVINDSQFDDEGVYTAEVEGKKTSAQLFVTGNSPSMIWKCYIQYVGVLVWFAGPFKDSIPNSKS